LDHSALLLRGQVLTGDDLIALSRRFDVARFGTDPGERAADR